MPGPRSIFRANANASRLVSAEQIQTAVDAIRKGGADKVEDPELADWLVAQRILTRYQADQILQGRTKFTLGPYIVTDMVGQGGMGQVFRAYHQVMGRECALKVLPKDRVTPESVANFIRESRMQAQLDHPNLVRAFDAGQEGLVHYLATEFVNGFDLRRLVRKQGALSVPQAAHVIRRAALALEYAHKRGLVHRDVKPGNILVTPDGIVKVSDLGLAGFTHEGDEDPRQRKIVGTADYLAPETIIKAGETTSLTDIYSLGCTLYYAVCGKVPFPGGSARDKARRHRDDMPWHPRRFNGDISEEFVEVIADMMEKDPTERIQSMAEVASRLEPWAGDAVIAPSRQMGKSSWNTSPLPNTLGEEAVSDPQDTDGGENSAPSAGTTSQISGGTPTFPAVTQDSQIPPPIAQTLAPKHTYSPQQLTNYILLTIGITVPLAMIAGALLAMLVIWLTK